jgi:hypothetical protein
MFKIYIGTSVLILSRQIQVPEEPKRLALQKPACASLLADFRPCRITLSASRPYNRRVQEFDAVLRRRRFTQDFGGLLAWTPSDGKPDSSKSAAEAYRLAREGRQDWLDQVHAILSARQNNA